MSSAARLIITVKRIATRRFLAPSSKTTTRTVANNVVIDATAVVEALSAAVSDVDPRDAAFPWRRQAACIQWNAETPSLDIVDAANAWLATAHETMGANSVGGYVNYVEPESAARYFRGNLSRLNAVRQQYDPDGLMYSAIQPGRWQPPPTRRGSP
jgi:hypothetical protein